MNGHSHGILEMTVYNTDTGAAGGGVHTSEPLHIGHLMHGSTAPWVCGPAEANTQTGGGSPEDEHLNSMMHSKHWPLPVTVLAITMRLLPNIHPLPEALIESHIGSKVGPNA